MEKIYLEDYYVGETFVSPGRTITEADIILFAAFTGDWHPLHTDREYAAGTQFKERIAHGMLGLAVGGALAFRLGPYVVLPKSFIAFYGIERVRFVAPVKIGDTIHCEVKVRNLTVRDEKTGILEEQQAIKNQRDETVIIFTTKYLIGRKPQEVV